MAYPTEPSDFVDENAPDSIATPEGDNEGLPDAPLAPQDAEMERPRGNEPHPSLPIRPALE